jgi:hypothetical protein
MSGVWEFWGEGVLEILQPLGGCIIRGVNTPGSAWGEDIEHLQCSICQLTDK